VATTSALCHTRQLITHVQDQLTVISDGGDESEATAKQHHHMLSKTPHC